MSLLYAMICAFDPFKWLSEHSTDSIPNLSEEEKLLVDNEFPLHSRWEAWIKDEYMYSKNDYNEGQKPSMKT